MTSLTTSEWPTDPMAQRIEAMRKLLKTFKDTSPSSMWNGYHKSEWPKSEDEILRSIQDLCKQTKDPAAP